MTLTVTPRAAARSQRRRIRTLINYGVHNFEDSVLTLLPLESGQRPSDPNGLFTALRKQVCPAA